MNGVAILIVLSQLPALLGVARVDWRSLGYASWGDLQPATAIVGGATALCIVVVARRSRNAPAYRSASGRHGALVRDRYRHAGRRPR